MPGISLFIESLNFQNLEYKEPVLLAALALEKPVLLIGEYGCSNNKLLERLSKELDISFHNCLAPQLNNTLMTNEEKMHKTEALNLDLIDKTFEDTQYDIISLITKSKIKNISLKNLKYCWATTGSFIEKSNNPICFQLMETFYFIIKTPSFVDLDEDDRYLVIKNTDLEEKPLKINLKKLVDKTKQQIEILKKSSKEEINKYIYTLTKLIEGKICNISIERVAILKESLYAIYAAKTVINECKNSKNKTTLKDVINSHIQNTLPFIFNVDDKKTLNKICNEAFEISIQSDTPDKEILLTENSSDKIEYVLKNINKLRIETIYNTVYSNIDLVGISKKRILSVICYLIFRNYDNVPKKLMYKLATEFKPVIQYERTIFENAYIREITKGEDMIYEVRKKYKDSSLNDRFLKALFYNILYSFIPNDRNYILMAAEYFQKLMEDKDICQQVGIKL